MIKLVSCWMSMHQRHMRADVAIILDWPVLIKLWLKTADIVIYQTASYLSSLALSLC